MIEPETNADLLALGLALGRLESRLLQPEHAESLRGWFLREEALAIAGAEGYGTDRTRLAAVVADVDTEMSDVNVRTARDAMEALRIVLSWDDRHPTPSDILMVWEVSNASQMRRVSPEEQWGIEQDCASFAACYDLLADGGPDLLAETLMRMHCHTGFKYKSTRMTRLLTPSLVRVALRLPNVILGAARPVSQALATLDLPSWDLNTTRGGTSDPDLQHHFHALLLGGLAQAATRIETVSATLAGLRKEMLSAYAGRSHSKAPAAVTFFAAEPVFTIARLADALGVTLEGSRHIVERFRASEHVVTFGDNSGKNQGFVCHKALNI